MIAVAEHCRVGGDVYVLVCLFCLLLSRRLARAQADSKDEQGGKSAIKHVKVLLAGGVDAGTQGRELRRCNSEFADRFVS